MTRVSDAIVAERSEYKWHAELLGPAASGEPLSIPKWRKSNYIVSGVQVEPTAGGTGRLEDAGGVAHGLFAKSKKSSRLGCAASRFVRCADAPINRFSTNLMTAV